MGHGPGTVEGVDAVTGTMEIAACFAPVFRRYGVQKAILFGSFARGEPSRRSDIDLILVQTTTRRFLDRLDGILHDLNKASPGPSVEALVYTPGEFEQMKNRGFVSRALKEGKVLYEQQRP